MGIDFAGTVRRRLAQRRQSQYRAAVSSGLPQDAIRSVLKGHVPRLDRVEEICRALDLQLVIDSAPGMRFPDDDPDPRMMHFNSSVRLPVRQLVQPETDVYLMRATEKGTRPAPVELDDARAFYASYFGHAMIPAGVWGGDLCLVSPCAKLEPGRRIWLRDRQGQEGLRWLIRITAATLVVGAWETPKPNGHQDLVPERWKHEDVADRGIILGVYRGWLTDGHRPFRLPEWRPARLIGLWRALFDADPELQTVVVEHLEAKTTAFDKKLTEWLKRGAVQRAEVQDLLQEVQEVKQLAQLLSPQPQSEASRNGPLPGG